MSDFDVLIDEVYGSARAIEIERGGCVRAWEPTPPPPISDLERRITRMLRRCKEPGCETALSSYNPGTKCFTHTEPEVSSSATPWIEDALRSRPVESKPTPRKQSPRPQAPPVKCHQIAAQKCPEECGRWAKPMQEMAWHLRVDHEMPWGEVLQAVRRMA